MSRPRNVTKIGLFLSQENDRMEKLSMKHVTMFFQRILFVQSFLALSSSIQKYVLSKFRGKIGFNKPVVRARETNQV